ncbi:MAG: class I SAM-dependent methyltransferase [Actinomycetota bacterium]
MPARAAARVRTYWLRTGRRERVTALLSQRISRLGGTVLDVGGGRRAPHDDSWRSGTRRVRLDLSPIHAPDIVGDARRLPIRDAGVDVVTIVEVLEHVADPWQVLDEAWRVLRPGGTVLGSAPFVWPVHGDPDDYFRFTEAGLRALLHRFEPVVVVPIGNHYSAAWNLVTARSRAARILNPAFRRLTRRADGRCPEGYVFEARR